MTWLKVPLSAGVKLQLKKAARKCRVTPARFVRETIEKRLQSEERDLSASLYELSRDLCGTVKDAPPDLARNKRHLQGYGAWKR